MTASYHPTPGALLWRLAMKWQAAVDRAVTPLGLTHAQYSLLGSLRAMTNAGDRPSQRELAEYTGLDAIFVSKLIATLERNGLVTRAKHPMDSRAVELSLTDVGVEAIDKAVVVVRDLQDQLTEPLGGLDSKNTKQFITTMQRLLTAPPHPEADNTKGNHQ
ncbi:MAG TPA: MarR family winged helix-turn-helix transcriptional regulator [Ilumatobacteraceae bacterium]|nr:MarR family winged helix-turn-helix transcriptional regulator [Ilumatobacteraceae bacterium]